MPAFSFVMLASDSTSSRITTPSMDTSPCWRALGVGCWCIGVAGAAAGGVLAPRATLVVDAGAALARHSQRPGSLPLARAAGGARFRRITRSRDIRSCAVLINRCRFAAVPLDDIERLALWCREHTPAYGAVHRTARAQDLPALVAAEPGVQPVGQPLPCRGPGGLVRPIPGPRRFPRHAGRVRAGLPGRPPRIRGTVSTR